MAQKCQCYVISFLNIRDAIYSTSIRSRYHSFPCGLNIQQQSEYHSAIAYCTEKPFGGSSLLNKGLREFTLCTSYPYENLLVNTLRVAPVVIGMAVEALTRVFRLELLCMRAHVRRLRVSVVEADEGKGT